MNSSAFPSGGDPPEANQPTQRAASSPGRFIIERRAEAAGLTPPAIHGFRRAEALAMLRNGADVVSVARLLGHKDLAVIQRYLKQTAEDLRQAHAANSPVDRAGLWPSESAAGWKGFVTFEWFKLLGFPNIIDTVAAPM
jgi:integrase